MFLGRYEHNIDAKGRLAIPARFRTELTDGLVLTRGIDRCLAVYPMSAWRPLSEKVSALPISDPDARNFRRMFFADAVDCELDKQGRIILPSHLREFSGALSEVIVVGMNTYIEIWDVRRWQEVQTTMDVEGASIAERLANLI
jgi:MraZ protein